MRGFGRAPEPQRVIEVPALPVSARQRHQAAILAEQQVAEEAYDRAQELVRAARGALGHATDIFELAEERRTEARKRMRRVAEGGI